MTSRRANRTTPSDITCPSTLRENVASHSDRIPHGRGLLTAYEESKMMNNTMSDFGGVGNDGRNGDRLAPRYRRADPRRVRPDQVPSFEVMDPIRT